MALGTYTSFAHRILWDSAQRHLEIAKTLPKDAWILHLSAALLSAAAFEAYLNYVGEEMLPEIWKHGRTYFSTREYRGTQGKFKRIAEELGYNLPKSTHKPFSSWRELVSIRDRLVHAKPKRATYKMSGKSNSLPKMPSTWLFVETRPERVERLIQQTQTLAEELHQLISASEFQNVVFGSHPFNGAIGFGIGSVEVAP